MHHPLRGVADLLVGFRQVVGAVVHGELIARTWQGADVQEKSERTDGERMLERDRVKVPPAPLCRIGAKASDELASCVLESLGRRLVATAHRRVAGVAEPRVVRARKEW